MREIQTPDNCLWVSFEMAWLRWVYPSCLAGCEASCSAMWEEERGRRDRHIGEMGSVSVETVQSGCCKPETSEVPTSPPKLGERQQHLRGSLVQFTAWSWTPAPRTGQEHIGRSYKPWRSQLLVSAAPGYGYRQWRNCEGHRAEFYIEESTTNQ